MKITIIGRKVNLKDNFKERVEKKLSKFERIFSESAEAAVTVTVEKNRQIVEVTINDNGMVYRAEETKLEMNDALDAVVDVLGGQIRKNKTKLSKKIRSGALETLEYTPTNEQQEENSNSESASYEIGKSVEESANELNTNNKTNTSNSSKTSAKTNNTNVSNQAKTNTQNQETTKTTSNQTTENKTENKKELKFQKPVEGEIVREYAQDNLIYSQTLEEWVTHAGIDIKAEKTTVVNAAEAGTVKTIKNDPRYGLTIIIDHEDGYQTIYSNLLTSEFVVEGEEVEKGQTIATVGNTAAFESADEPHLHFEILKDSIQVDPNMYLK